MKFDVSFIPEGLLQHEMKNRITVMIDVLRASTTIITAIKNHAKKIVPLPTPADVLKEAENYPASEILLCGERNSLKIPGFDLGNSPKEYSRNIVSGKTLLFTSTNGSQVFSKVKFAYKCLIAGFVNMDSVVDCILNNKRDCLIMCAGDKGRLSLEDLICAGMILNEIKKTAGEEFVEMNDSAWAAYVMYEYCKEDVRSMIEMSNHGRFLLSLGRQDDILYCTSLNIIKDIPCFREQSIINEELTKQYE